MWGFPETSWDLATQLLACAFAGIGLGVIAGTTLLAEPDENTRKSDRWNHFLEGFGLWLLVGVLGSAVLASILVTVVKAVTDALSS